MKGVGRISRNEAALYVVSIIGGTVTYLVSSTQFQNLIQILTCTGLAAVIVRSLMQLKSIIATGLRLAERLEQLHRDLTESRAIQTADKKDSMATVIQLPVQRDRPSRLDA